MTINRLGLGVGAVAIFLAGALVMYVLGARAVRSGAPEPAPARSVPAGPNPAGSAAGPLLLTVSPALLARAGIRIETVQSGAPDAGLRVPGTVRPNAYRKVSVTPLAGGRVTRVPIELGQHVSRGATLAEIYSPDLADARTRYLSAQADFEAGEARVARTERLAQIGAASQQELEGALAEHTRHQTEVEQASARLRLLGVDPAHVTHVDAATPASSTVRVAAPQEGVVLERPVTVGMTVESSTVVATLVDLSPVWVIADLYERDFAAVRVGTGATVATDAYPGAVFPGKVTYLSPEVRPETRTAEVRVEVANPSGQLRLGMFVTVTLAGLPRPGGPVIPRAAVQTVGARTVVYLALDQSAGRFEERPVVLGKGDEERVSVTAGLLPGDRIVTAGNFSLRAEVERQGLRPPAAADAAVAVPSPAQSFAVRVTAVGFEPDTLTLREGIPARVTFTRTTDDTCVKEVVLPDYGLRKALPLNQPVAFEFVPKKGGTGEFACGMNMVKGTLVVK